MQLKLNNLNVAKQVSSMKFERKYEALDQNFNSEDEIHNYQKLVT